MLKNFSRAALAAAFLAALPGTAHAGSATATSTASLSVISQCAVNGATVDLGTFRTTDTWATVGAALGTHDSTINVLTYTPGSRGQEYLNFGSVICNAGTPWTLSIKPAVGAGIDMRVNGKAMQLSFALKRIGGTVVPDLSGTFPGVGNFPSLIAIPGTGTGATQTLLGNAMTVYGTPTTTALATDRLTVAGTYSDTLTYTLTF